MTADCRHRSSAAHEAAAAAHAGRAGGGAPRRIYSDVKSLLREAIEAGGWRPGFKLPSERELAERFECARATVRRALQDLEADGLVERRHGSGSYVADLLPMASVLSIKDIHEEITERGHTHRSVVVSREVVRAATGIAEAMGLARGARVFRCEVVHYENGEPIQLEERYVNPQVAPDFMSVDLTRRTASGYLFEHAPLTAAEQVVEAINADARLCRHLPVAPGDAVLKISRRTISKGRVASLARLYHPGKGFRLAGSFSTE